MNSNTIVMPYPISTNRYYRTFRNITSLSKEGKLFKHKVKLANLRLKPTLHDVMIDITIHPKQRKNGNSYNQIIDIDNGLKCILDSLIGIVYNDDRQVKDLHVAYGTAKIGGAATVVVSKFQKV
jgi:crossover junction endodeoxyribonuclease RusA